MKHTDAPNMGNPLLSAFVDGSLARKLKRYLKSCRPPDDADPKREPGRLANPAGFCIFLGCGLSCMDELAVQIPAAYDYIRTVFEDELLNAARIPSAGLATAYLKERLGFGGLSDKDGAPLQLVFAHDMEEDGA